MSNTTQTDNQTDSNSSPARKTNTSIESWVNAAKVYTEQRVFILMLLGFSAGLPFLLVFSTLSAWLHEAGVSRTTIGFFSWIGITYSIKVVWAPIVDRLEIPFLTRLLGARRSWMLIAQLGMIIGLAGMAMTQPNGLGWAWLPGEISGLYQLALLALLVAFSSATQDIAIDAYRIEVADSSRQGAMSAAYIFGYRIALLVAGAGALAISDSVSWSTTYLIMAGCVGVGILAVICAPNTERRHTIAEEVANSTLAEMLWVKKRTATAPKWVATLACNTVYTLISPLLEFFEREGRWALYLLMIVSVYKISDITMGVMANPFYLDMGYTKSQIAAISKFLGFFMTLLGSFVAGLVVVKMGLLRPLLWGALLVAGTNLLFAFLALQPTPSLMILGLVISTDNFSGGMANVAFIAFLSNLTNRSFTATQYALFSSLMTLPGKIIGGYSGTIVDAQGYFNFFLYAAMLGIPAIILVYFLCRFRKDLDRSEQPDQPAEQ